MRGIRALAVGKVCAVLTFAVAVLFSSDHGECQTGEASFPTGIGIVERPELARPDAQKPEEAQFVIGMPPGFMTGVNVWIEATFIQMERGITRHFEESIGFKLSPPDGKALLNAEEKETILAAVEKTEKARIIASLSCLTIPGQQTQTEHVEEFTYPTEYKAEGDTIVPGNWEQRDIGAILNVTPVSQETEEGALITLILMPEVTTLCGWKTYDGSEFGQPIFMTSNITTTVAVPDGMTFVLKQAPVTSPFVSQAVDLEEATSPENQVTLLLLVSAKVVPYE